MKNHILIILLSIAINSFSQNYNKLFKSIESEDFDKAILLVDEFSSEKKLDSSIILLANALIYSNNNYAFYNPIKAYSAYKPILGKNPFINSKKANEIAKKFNINLNELKVQIENKIYEQVSNSENIEKLNQIILICNQCNYLEKAKIQLENTEFKKAKLSNTMKDYDAFIDKYPNSSNLNEIIEKRDLIAFNKSINSLKDLNAFILKYHDSNYIKMALKMKDSIINNAESIRYFENGKIASKGKYKNDMKEGNWVEYNYDGTIYNSCNYKADLLHGEFRQYDENGRLSSIINHENGEKIFNDGELITYQSNGAIESKCFYKNGKLEGIKTYYSWNNGVVIKEENYINGKLNGLLIERRGNGEIWRTQNYLNGLRNGEGTDKLNGCKEINNYLNDTLNGNYTKKDKFDNIICSGQYNKGQKVGYWIWGDDGIHSGKLLWEGNLTDGIVKYYDYKGNVYKICNYKKGKLNGPYKSTYNGVTVEEGSNKNGYPVGQWKMNYSDGKPKFIGFCSENGKYINFNKFESLFKTEFFFYYYPIFFSDYCEFFYNNGTTFFKGNFTNGEVNYYLMDGKPYMNEKYKNGILIKTEYYNTKFKPLVHTIKLEYNEEIISKVELHLNNSNLKEIFENRDINLSQYPVFKEDNGNKNEEPIQIIVYNNDTIIFIGYSKYFNSSISNQNSDRYKTGPISYFNNDLSKNAEGQLINGEREGVWEIYNRHGEILEAHYSKDEIKTYYPNGSIFSIEKCKNYILNGESIFYYENGNVKSKVHYLNGKKDCQIIE